MLGEFKDFINKGNVVDMAVGIIIGAAFTTIVKSLVGDIIMPIAGVFSGGIDFANNFIVLGEGEFATLAAAKEAGVATLNYGVFINALINFLIVAFAVFILVKNVNKMKKAEEENPEEPAEPPRQEVLLEAILNEMKAK